MTKINIARRLLIYEAIGFTILIAVSWFDALIGLPPRLFGGSYAPNWHVAAFQTAIIFVAAVPTLILTLRLARRLIYLEGFLHICACCHRIGENDEWENDEWISMEHFFDHKLGTKNLHGICPDCAEMIERKFSKSAAEQADTHLPGTLPEKPAEE